MAENWKRSWIEPLADDTEFFEARFADLRFPPHVHETFAIGVIESGAQRFATATGETIRPADTLCVMNPDVVHWSEPAHEVGCQYRMFYPSDQVVAAALETSTSSVERIGFGTAVIHDEDLFRRFRALHRNASIGDRFGLDEAVLTFVADLVARHAPVAPTRRHSRSTRTATTVKEFLHDHTFDPVTLADMGLVAGVTGTHVSRAFRAEFGMSPYAYLLALRIERSKAFLMAGQSIAVAATASGFYDQSHYHRMFRRLVGVTPGRFVQSTN